MDVHKVRSEFLRAVKDSMLRYDCGESALAVPRWTLRIRVDEVMLLGVRCGLISEALFHTIRQGFIIAPKVTADEMHQLLALIDWNLEQCKVERSEVAGQ